MSASTNPLYTESWLTGPQNHKFYTRTYIPSSPPRAAVLFIHGFIEHIDRYAHVFPRYTARNILVFAFDQRGFGRSAEDKAERSKDAAYGKTGTKDALEDVQWAVGVVREKVGEGVPVFVTGHSMGGALSLYYATTPTPPQHSVAGIISTSPLILQAVPASKIQRWVGGKLCLLTPNVSIPAPVNASDLSHDPAVGEKYLKDPLVKEQATLRCISDMLNRGEELLHSRYKNWPENLPLLIIHGTADKVTSHKASEEFVNKIGAKDKTFIPFADGYHELHNEPDGVSEKLCEEVIKWIEAHSPATTATAAEDADAGAAASATAGTPNARL